MLKHITVPIIVDDHEPEKCGKECEYLEYGGIYCNLKGKRLIRNQERCAQCIDELETFLQHEERGGERIKPVIMGTQMPVHADLSDCCGFFMDLRDTGLYCNECGVEISVAWGQFYMQVKETMQAMWGGTKHGVHMNFNDCETGALEKWFSLGRMLGLFGDKGMK